MLATKVLSAIALIATPIVADGVDAIVDALATLSASTADLNNTVAAWNGNLLGTLPIVIKSGELLSNTNKATKAAENSANLTLIEAVTIATSIQDLIEATDTTLTTLVEAKPKFDHLLLSAAILLNLVLEKHATSNFGAAIVSKVPPEVADLAEQIAAQADELFDKAIDVYDGPF